MFNNKVKSCTVPGGKAGAINEATSPPGRKESQEQIAAALVLLSTHCRGPAFIFDSK